jgi:hypothetical protein
MRTFIGMIIGCLLTVAVVYMHDALATSLVDAGPGASRTNQIVNWDVAAGEWGRMKENIRIGWDRLTRSFG